jgi:hypothetical protein
MLRLICAIWIVASGVQAEPLKPGRVALFLAFAQTASGDDPEVMDAVRRYVLSPPVTDEVIGFYSMSEAPAPERSLRAILTVLVDNGYILDLEVRYLMMEFEGVLLEAGALGPTTNVPDLVSSIPDGDWGDPAFQAEAMTALAMAIGPFARAVEEEAKARDRVTLQLSVPFGDAVFFWVTTPEIAEDWRCVSLWYGPDIWRDGQTIDIGVDAVDWLQFYDLIRIGPVGGGAADPSILDVPMNDCATP